MSDHQDMDGETNMEEKKPINNVEGKGGAPGEGQQAVEVRQPHGSRRRGCYLSKTQGIIIIIIIFAIIILLAVVVALLAATRCSCDGTEESLPLRMTTPRPTLDPSLPWSEIRLPRSLIPLHYNLELNVDVDSFSFSGWVTMDLMCEESTHYAMVHVHALNIDRSKVSIEDLSHPSHRVPTITEHHDVPLNQFHVLKLSSPLTKGHKYRLKFGHFTGIIEDDLRGLYRSMYKDKNGTTR